MFIINECLSCVEDLVWKRPVKDIREMCDSCSTTLFNVHWTCERCGHVICLDCYNALRQCTHSPDTDCSECKPCKQILQRCCVRRRLHSVDDLMPTQIIPRDGLWHSWFMCSFIMPKQLVKYTHKLLKSTNSETKVWVVFTHSKGILAAYRWYHMVLRALGQIWFGASPFLLIPSILFLFSCFSHF